MKRAFSVVALLVGMSNLSMYSDRYTSILDSADYNWERLDVETGEPALSSPSDDISSWESFNRWQCFPTSGVEFQCAEAQYEGLRRVPLFHVEYASHLYEFSMETDPAPDCDKVLNDWKKLFKGEDAFCVYAAYLQKLEFQPKDGIDGSVWMINRLKTRKGYWSFDSDENYIR